MTNQYFANNSLCQKALNIYLEHNFSIIINMINQVVPKYLSIENNILKDTNQPGVLFDER